MAVNPFDALGLPARPDLTDEQVRAAWRAIAAATHPDRRDGGDVARYTAATAAYAVLRTPWGRSEAFADLALAVGDTSPLPAVDGSTVEGGPAASTGGGRPGDLLAAVVQLPARRPEGTHHRLLQRGDDHDRAQPEDETLVIDALRMAVENRRPRTGYPGAAALRRGLRCRGPARRLLVLACVIAVILGTSAAAAVAMTSPTGQAPSPVQSKADLTSAPIPPASDGQTTPGLSSAGRASQAAHDLTVPKG